MKLGTPSIQPVPWKAYREKESFEDFTFILAYPILFTGTKALQNGKTKELWQFQKAFSLKTEGWSVSRLRRKILLECLKKSRLLRLAEKSFQWDQHTQRALLYNHFSLSAESVHWSKNLVGFMLAAWYMVCPAPAGKDGGLLSSSSLEKKQEQSVPGQRGFFPVQARKWPKHWPQKKCGPKLQDGKVHLGLLPYQVSPHFLHRGVRHQPTFSCFLKKWCKVELCWHCSVYSHIAGCCREGKSEIKENQQNQNPGPDHDFSYLKILQRHPGNGEWGANRKCSISIEKLGRNVWRKH